jgi:hypothetical protein
MVDDDEGVGLDAVEVVFDDERVVSDAGIMLIATLAERFGIERLVGRLVVLRRDRPGAANAGRKVMALIYAMLLGADSIDECEVLRAGRTRRLLGGWLPAPSTLGTFLRAFSFGHVRQLDRLLADTLTRAWRAALALATGAWLPLRSCAPVRQSRSCVSGRSNCAAGGCVPSCARAWPDARPTGHRPGDHTSSTCFVTREPATTPSSTATTGTTDSSNPGDPAGPRPDLPASCLGGVDEGIRRRLQGRDLARKRLERCRARARTQQLLNRVADRGQRGLERAGLGHEGRLDGRNRGLSGCLHRLQAGDDPGHAAGVLQVRDGTLEAVDGRAVRRRTAAGRGRAGAAGRRCAVAGRRAAAAASAPVSSAVAARARNSTATGRGMRAFVRDERSIMGLKLAPTSPAHINRLGGSGPRGFAVNKGRSSGRDLLLTSDQLLAVRRA